MEASGEGKRQVADSLVNIETTLRNTNQEIAQILQKNQKLQKESRLYDDKRSKERYNSIQEEAILSNKKNTALEMKWSELKEEEECEKLYHAIQEQNVSFQMIADGKDRLIKQFQDELKKKDDNYSKKIKDEAVDIKDLVSQMRSQFFTLRDQHLRELEEIQKKFQSQRKKYIDESIKNVDGSFQKHVDMQQSFAEGRRKGEDEFTKKIQDLRIEGSKHYSMTKIQLEKEIQNLEKCHEEMKALYQLNTQKLDYNLKVLKESKEQNHNKLTDLTKKERTLNDKLRKLKEEYEKADRAFKENNKALTQEYKRITEQFKDLQRKFKHFQKADLDKYNEIQAMNESEVQKLKDKIIKCDVTIHLQQLGMRWAGVPTTEDTGMNQRRAIPAPNDDDSEGEQTKLAVEEWKLTEVLGILVDEADFMFDYMMREQLEKATLEQSIDRKLDLLKKTLCIDSIDQLNIFLYDIADRCKWVSEKQKQAELQRKLKKEQQAREEEERQLKKMKRVKAEDKKVEKEEKKEESFDQPEARVDLNSDFKVDSTQVVQFLTWWMSTKDERKKLLERTTKKSLKQLSEREKKEHIARQGKKYWQNLTQVLPQRTFRVWKVLDKALSKYYDLLKNRQQLIDETAQLHNQNQELKKLLNNYLQIDHQLKIPPTKLMDKDQTF